jgi:hypothetical protein
MEKESSSKNLKINTATEDSATTTKNQENPVVPEKTVGCQHYKRRAKFVVRFRII